MPLEVFTNDGLGTVTAGGTTAPAPGTVESWTVTATNAFPSAASTGTPPVSFYVADLATAYETEKMLVTVAPGGASAGQAWTVTRGADGTTPVAHVASFSIGQAVTRAGMQSLQATLGTALNVVTQFGADPTGTNDSGAAVAAALAALPAGGGTLYFPGRTAAGAAASYKNNTGAWTPVSNMRITSDGRGTCNIFSTSNALFNCATGSFTDSVEIDHVTLQATSAHVFTGANCARWKIHDCQLIQNSAGFSIWNASITTQIMIECVFERNLVQVYGATRTVEAWFLTTTSGASNAIAHNTWQNNVTFNNGNDVAKYIYHLQSTSNVNNSNSFINETFEHPFGGMIWLESHSRGTILHCYAEDLNSGTATISNSLIYISKNSGGGASSFNTIINSPRIASGVAFAASISDIQLDSNCVSTVIENPQAPSGTLILDIGNSSLVTLLALPPGVTLSNHATATWGSARLANGAPATAVSYQPANPSSTVSATNVMMGLGTTCVLTPLSSGKVLVNVTGVCTSLTAAANVFIGPRYGTGTAPANGVAATGTRFGANADSEMGSSLTPVSRPFAFTDVLTLTPGTAYWFDLAISTSTVADAAEVNSVSMTLVETA